MAAADKLIIILAAPLIVLSLILCGWLYAVLVVWQVCTLAYFAAITPVLMLLEHLWPKRFKRRRLPDTAADCLECLCQDAHDIHMLLLKF